MPDPRYPLYVISKGRADSRLTVKAFDEMAVPYRIVVEPQEYEAYAAVIDPQRIITTPFSNLGMGSIPVRNFVWEHAEAEGFHRHWVVDDNIKAFYRYNRNLKVPVRSPAIFAAMEDFTDRYENIAISGPNYFMFQTRKTLSPPLYINTRVYSCILIDNRLPFRWRGRYNEDTDLSLRALKAGYCTILFQAFLAEKMTTMTMHGGNTDDLYRQDSEFDGRWEMAESLRRQHPDVVKVTRKWGRWQHSVNYKPFKANTLIRRPDVDWDTLESATNEYGLRLTAYAKPT